MNEWISSLERELIWFLKKEKKNGEGEDLLTCSLRPFKSEEYIDAKVGAAFVAVVAAEKVEFTE